MYRDKPKLNINVNKKKNKEYKNPAKSPLIYPRSFEFLDIKYP